MESEYLFHYGKPQTASFSGADIVSAGLIVAIPYVRKLVLSYTRTVIGNFDSVSLSGPPYAEDYDFTALLTRLAMTCLILFSSP